MAVACVEESRANRSYLSPKSLQVYFTEYLFQPAQESHPLSQASAPTMHTVPVAESQRDVGLVEAWVEGWKGGILVAPWEGGGLRLG